MKTLAAIQRTHQNGNRQGDATLKIKLRRLLKYTPDAAERPRNKMRPGAGLFNALYMNLIDCSAAMPPIARLYLVLATFSARLKRRMFAANERILAKTPGFLRIREASSAKLPSRT